MSPRNYWTPCIHALLFLHSQTYLSCLKDSKDVHHKCKELSRDYLQCRMDHQLMSQENLESVSQLRKHEGSHSMFDLFLIRRSFFFCCSSDFQKNKRSRAQWNMTRGGFMAYLRHSASSSYCHTVVRLIPHDTVCSWLLHSKEKAGFIAGKHITASTKWWFQPSSRRNWKGDDKNEGE